MKLLGVRDDHAAVTAIGIEWPSDQRRELLKGSAPRLHFYTLNRSYSTWSSCGRMAGLYRPSPIGSN